jgi:hypothetical protein
MHYGDIQGLAQVRRSPNMSEAVQSQPEKGNISCDNIQADAYGET